MADFTDVMPHPWAPERDEWPDMLPYLAPTSDSIIRVLNRAAKNGTLLYTSWISRGRADPDMDWTPGVLNPVFYSDFVTLDYGVQP